MTDADRQYNGTKGDAMNATKISWGARRITRLIAGDDDSAIFVHGDHENFDERGWMTQDDLAAIIDRETAAPQMLDALEQADLQIEYLQEKFKETGSGNSVRAQIQAAILAAKGETA